MKNENENENGNNKEEIQENKNENENEKKIETVVNSVSDAQKKRRESDNRQIMKAFGMVTQLGLTMAACIIIGLFVGIFLDNWLKTSPLFLIIFVFVGAAAAIKVLYDISKDWK